jgi:uncharacterized membrane protein YkvA (DUF1232 family)
VPKLREWARGLKRDTVALYFACRDPRTPWYARAVAGFCVAYALSPIDLIPDFVPVVGYVDDLIIVPLGLALAVKMIPRPVLAECRAKAQVTVDRPTNRVAAALIVGIWVVLAACVSYLVARAFLL